MAPFCLRIEPLGGDDALVVASWRYPPPYDAYDIPPDDPESLAELLNGSYYAAFAAGPGPCGHDSDGCDGGGGTGIKGNPDLVGFFCFGASAQVPPLRPQGAYVDTLPLDIGLGMRPDLTGWGRGAGFVQAGMAWAAGTFGVRRFRLTVACFNVRAIRAYEAAGFQRGPVYTIDLGEGPRSFMVMLAPALPQD